MRKLKGGDGVENYTSLIKAKLPALPPAPEEVEEGEAEVGHSPPPTVSFSITPPVPARESSSTSRQRSPRQDSAASNGSSKSKKDHHQHHHNSSYPSHHYSSVTSQPPSATQQRPDAPGILLKSTTARSTGYGNSSISTTGTDCYPSSGPLLRKMAAAADVDDDGEDEGGKGTPHRVVRHDSTGDSPHQEDLPHLHDFLLQSSATSLNATGRPNTPSDNTPSAPLHLMDNSSTLPPAQPSEATAKPESETSQKNSQRSNGSATAQSHHHHSNASRRTSPQRQDPLDCPLPQLYAGKKEELPPRQMVRRGAGSPTDRAPAAVVEPRITSSVTVRESHGALTADVAVTKEVVHLPGPTDTTTHSFDPTQPHSSGAAETPTANTHTPADLLAPSFHGNNYADIDAAAHAASVAAGVSADLPIRETFPIPRYCPDDLLRGEDKLWSPGKPLRIAYVTWNMANKAPKMEEVSAYCVHPNAHLIVVGTQENGPYIGSNKMQQEWAQTIEKGCLGGQYELVSKHHMWAIHMLVFARSRDVAKYVSRAHASHVKTGMLNGLGGNKGGVAVGLVLSLTPKFVEVSHRATTQRAVTTAPPTPRGAENAGDNRVEEGDDDDGDEAGDSSDAPALSASAAAGPAPPALLDPSVMQHDADDDDDDDSRGGGGGGGGAHRNRHSGQSTATVAHTAGRTQHDALDNDDGVFSPAEMVSRNASFDLSRERQRRQKQKSRLRRSFKWRARGNGSTPAHAAQHFGQDVDDDEDDVNADDSGDATSDGDTPNYMTLLFITAHLAAHQGAVVNRNKDYRQIVHGLQLGRRGPHRKFFKHLLRQRRVVEGDGASNQDENWEDDSSEDDVVPLSLPVVSAIVNRGKTRRDVTEEFDLTFFGGDLNYRINGTRKAIEYVIQHHRNIRSILINNDQLSLERARGTVFQGYQEGNLLFRPTYKYEVSKSNGGVTLDEYNFSKKKDRMPAYCDRVLFKKKLSSAARRIAIRLYTDVPNVRTSDHRPVVALFDVGTRAYGS